MEKLHPQILHFEKCRGAHERGEIIENLHDGYGYKPCISTFMSACVSLQMKDNDAKQASTSEKCFFLDYDCGTFGFDNCEEFDNIENMLEKCQIIYSYLNPIHEFLFRKADHVEELYENEISFLNELNLKSIVLDLLERHMKNMSNMESRSHESYLCFSLYSSVIEKIMQMILIQVCGEEFQNPPTFSDLLTHEKIESQFDKKFLNFMRLTLAHPGGLNLRNLLWHGFISQSQDFNDKYTSLTFIILMTILKSQKSLESQILSQEKVKRWKSGQSDRVSSRIQTYGLYSENFKRPTTLEEIEMLCNYSYFIPPDRKELILSCFKEFLGDEENGHVNFVYLIIPQLEHFLRRVYICTNNLDTDLLLAKSREFFTIIDNILAFEIRLTKSEEEEEEEGEEDKGKTKVVPIEAKNNFLWKEIGVINHQRCLDLFFLAEGLRIRDVIAHSEIHPMKIPRNVSERIFQVALDLISSFDIRRKKEGVMRDDDLSSFPIFHPKTRFFEKLGEIKNYFCGTYVQKMKLEDDEDLSMIIQRTKEVSGFECVWTRKGFVYRKLKKKKKKKEEEEAVTTNETQKKKKKNAPIEFSLFEVEEFLDFQYDKIIQESKNKEIIKQFLLGKSSSKLKMKMKHSHPVMIYIESILQQQEQGEYKKGYNIVEDYDLCYEFRKKILNNVGIARTILGEVQEIMRSLEKRFDDLYTLVKTRKATTSKRKNFGCLIKTLNLFSKFMEIQVTLTLDLLISSFSDTKTNQDEELKKKLLKKQEYFYHKRLFRLMSVVNRCRLDVGTGKIGKIIKECIFSQFNIVKWKKNN